jgi:type I restriction enzyme, R subunit
VRGPVRPGKDKQHFCVFDYCQNLEYFSQDMPATGGALAASLGKRLFNARLELILALDARLAETDRGMVREPRASLPGHPQSDDEVRAQVAAMLQREVAGLPSELDPEGEEAKRFDLLVLNLQLALLRAEPAYVRLREQVKALAGLLEEKSSIPMVRDQMALIQDVQTEEWWQDVTVPMLEGMRRRLRDLIKLIDKQQRKPIYTDFEDEMGGGMAVDLPGFGRGTDEAKFRAKAQAFLRAHQDHVTVHKLRTNRALTAADLAELQRMLAQSGVGGADDIQRAADQSRGLGLFVRSLVGLDRQAAKEALAGFLAGKTLGANQIEFVNLIVNHLTEHGVMEATMLYESPFTDLTPRGPDGIFSSAQVDELMAAIEQVRRTAIAG